MKKATRSLACVLLALALSLSLAALPAITVQADTTFNHPLSDTATDADKRALEELKNIGAAHINSFDTSDFTLPYGSHFGDTIVNDAEAYNGMAAKMTAESRGKETNNALKMTSPTSFIQMTLVDPANGETNVSSDLKAENLIADGNYHLYKLENVVVHRGGIYKFLLLFSDWGFQLESWGERLAHLANQKVNFYLSMKIEGDMTFSDASNLPVYYIDRIIVTGLCSECDIQETGTVEATCTKDAGISGICTVCGENTVKYEFGTMLDHAFTNYVTNADGSQTAECDYGCGATDIIPAPTEAPEETTAPEETEDPEQTTAPAEEPSDEKDDPKPSTSAVLSPVVQIIFDIVIVSLLITAIVLVAVSGKKKISLILIATAIVLMVAVIILFLTGIPTRNNTSSSDSSGDATQGTDEGDTPHQTSPTTPALTAENSLDLSSMKVVIPATPTQVEINAAQELVGYVNKMTGQTLRIVKEGSAVEAGIYVGDTDFAKANNVTYPTTQYGEGWAIKAVDGNLVLCGEAVRGTLYAVYHLLEDALGVHWWTYTEEYVPNVTAALVWNKYDDSGAPAFEYRNMHPGGYINIETMFQVRNRLNGHDSNSPAGYGGEEVYGAPVYVHSFAYYLPDSLYQTHPEWFSLVNGERITGGQMCMTNPDLAEYVTNEMLGYIANDIAQSERTGTARPRWYALVPNDYQNFCECTDCAAAIEKSGLSGYLLQFVNKVAEDVAEEYPEVLIDTLAYQHYMQPPLDDTKPADNVMIRFAHDQMDVYHSISHENNVKMLEWVKAWRELTPEHGQYFYWDYLVTYKDAGPATFMYKFPDHFQTLLEVGFNGYFGEQENPINSDFWDMKMWLATKMLEDPYQDFNALVDTFLNGYYGAAGPFVREYLDLAEEKLASAPNYVTPYTKANAPKWLKLEDVIAADAIFDKAFDAVKGDEQLLVRLRLARNCLDRAILELFDYYTREAAKQGVDFNLDKLEVCQRLVDCIHEQLALRGQYDYTVAGGVNDYGWVGRYEDMLTRLTNK